MNGEALGKNVPSPRTLPDYLAITREILLKHVDIEVGRVVSGRPGVWAFRCAERGDDVVAPGYAGMVACRRASPTAEAVG